MLTVADRVAYQRAIEEVYWRHRIWPKERFDPKPPLDEVMPPAQLEKKVDDYLRDSQAIEDYLQQPITAEQLQSEMDRMAQHTKDPEVLRELFGALGNNPFIIAECLARPILSERLKPATVEWHPGPLSLWEATAQKEMPKLTAAANAKYVLSTVSDGPNGCAVDTWTVTSITNAPDVRWYHTAVWTGSEMIVWGGINNSGSLDTGGRYNPSTDSWTATSTTNAPARRGAHTAVWTGSEMIVWGGFTGSNYLNTGGRYNPSADSWTATSTTNAPDARYFHTAVWTGNKMIVWGGTNSSTSFNTGGTYDPSSDSWTPTSTTNAPDARRAHTPVWTGSEMIVWGGDTASDAGNSGGRYNPNSNSWTAMSTANAPDARHDHTVVWTGSEMIVWGGDDDSRIFNTGGRYNPSTDTWTPTSMTNVPSARAYHSAVWTGSEMILWGGYDGKRFFDTGAKYNPLVDSWTATGFTNAPSARYHHTAVWTSSEMIIWGGYGRSNSSFFMNTGGRYCAQSPTPNARANLSLTENLTLPVKNFVQFALRNFTLTLLVIGLFASGIAMIRAPKPLTTAAIVEALFSYFLLFSIGFFSLYNFIAHTVFAEMSAQFIGWENSPFQVELGFANLGFAVIGFLAFRGSFKLRVGTILGSACFLLGAAVVHIHEMVAERNFAPGNAGVIFYTDMLIPLIGFVLLWLQHRSQGKITAARGRD